jgi:acyl-coenzyme A synthetase/AMP-(fatty) acid ligase
MVAFMNKHCLINDQKPTQTAVITEDGEVITYAKLFQDINEATLELNGLQRLFIICQNDYIALVYYLAALQSKTVVLLLGIDTPIAQLNNLISRYQPCGILAYQSLLGYDNNEYRLYRTLSNYQFLIRNNKTKVTQFNALSLLLSTSGSTGCPKLVRLSLENLQSNSDAIIEYLAIDNSQIALAHLPFYYSYGLSVVNTHLRAGASIVLTNHSIVSREFWHQMKTYKITSLAGVPFHFEMLLKLRFEKQDLSHLTTLTQAGGKLDNTLIEKFAHIAMQKSIRFFVMYGQTEASPRMTYLSPEFLLKKIGSIGKPIPGGKIFINPEHKDSNLGELVFQGKNVCLGYAEQLNDLSKADENNGILYTGDIGYIDDDGFIFICGRKSRFLKVFGNRISLDELEHILTTMGIDNAVTGYDDHIKIYVIGDNLNINEIKQTLARNIGIHISAFSIKLISDVPRLANGKVDYQWLMNH